MPQNTKERRINDIGFKESHPAETARSIDRAHRKTMRELWIYAERKIIIQITAAKFLASSRKEAVGSRRQRISQRLVV